MSRYNLNMFAYYRDTFEYFSSFVRLWIYFINVRIWLEDSRKTPKNNAKHFVLILKFVCRMKGAKRTIINSQILEKHKIFGFNKQRMLFVLRFRNSEQKIGKDERTVSFLSHFLSRCSMEIINSQTVGQLPYK